MTNFTLDRYGNLVYVHTGGTLARWDSTPKATKNYSFITKDYDFGQPAQRKTIYKLYVTYYCKSEGTVKLMYAKNGNTEFTEVGVMGITIDNLDDADTPSTLNPGKPVVFPLKLSNVYSIRFKIAPVVYQLTHEETGEELEETDVYAVDNSFKLNDISIVFRLKGVN